MNIIINGSESRCFYILEEVDGGLVVAVEHDRMFESTGIASLPQLSFPDMEISLLGRSPHL